MAWFEIYERDVNGAPGAPWPTRPRATPAPEPPTCEPPEVVVYRSGTTLLGSVFDVIRGAVAAVRR